MILPIRAFGDGVLRKMCKPSRAGIILPDENEENEDLLMLVMPMMLNSPSA